MNTNNELLIAWQFVLMGLFFVLLIILVTISVIPTRDRNVSDYHKYDHITSGYDNVELIPKDE